MQEPRTAATEGRRGLLHRLLGLEPMTQETADRTADPLKRRHDPATPIPYACPAVLPRAVTPMVVTLAEVMQPPVFLGGTRNRAARTLAAHPSARPIEVRAPSKEDLQRFCAGVHALDLGVTFLPMRSISGSYASRGWGSGTAWELFKLDDFRTCTAGAPGEWQPRAVLLDEAVSAMGHTLVKHLQHLVEEHGAPETFRTQQSLYQLLDDLRASYSLNHRGSAPF